MAVRLFNALRSEAQFLRLIVQDATNSLAVAYKVCHPLKFICDIAYTYSLILLIQQFHVSSINWNFGRVIFRMVVMSPSVVLGHDYMRNILFTWMFYLLYVVYLMDFLVVIVSLLCSDVFLICLSWISGCTHSCLKGFGGTFADKFSIGRIHSPYGRCYIPFF